MNSYDKIKLMFDDPKRTMLNGFQDVVAKNGKLG